eukprot:TRINITY_DN11135_c4_g1_i1.p1 TRINITY_DN11135_c4_g1~~TRINITY_DN11135_c4_g1_i1.p1  ORF type:complete len:424 (-),score=86.89 TRINITY_DN11135_c4_g1_i1:81-1295(-)
MAKDQLQAALPDLRTELLGPVGGVDCLSGSRDVGAAEGSKESANDQKDGQPCERVFLSHCHCSFISQCNATPRLCAVVHDMELQGLRIVSVRTLIHGSRENLMTQLHRLVEAPTMRLLCIVQAGSEEARLVQTSSVAEDVREGREGQQLKTEGTCAWFEKSAKHGIYTDAFTPGARVLLAIDVLHPAYYSSEGLDVEVFNAPGGLLRLQGLIAQLADASYGGTSWPGSNVQLLRSSAPEVFRSGPRVHQRWMKLSIAAASLRVDSCALGDHGELLARALLATEQLEEAALVLRLSACAAALREKTQPNRASERLLARFQQLSWQDLQVLSRHFAGCLAHGCEKCSSLELTGTCLPGVAERGNLRSDLLSAFLAATGISVGGDRSKHGELEVGNLSQWLSWLDEL